MLAKLAALLSHVRPYWPYYLIGAVAVIGTNLSDLGTTFVVRYAVDAIGGEVPAPDDHVGRWLHATWGAGPQGTRGLLIPLAIAFVGCVVCQGCLRLLWRWGMVFNSFRIARDARRTLFTRLQAADHAYFDRAQTGELLSIATADIEAMRMFLGIGLLLIVDTTLYFLMVPIVMWRVDWQLTLIVLIPLPLIPLMTSKVSGMIHARFSACQEQLAELAAFAQESVAGVAVTKGFVQERSQTEAFDAHSRACREKQIGLARVQALMMPMLTFMVGLEIFLVMLFGGRHVLAGLITPGALFQFLMMTLMLTFPMMGLGWTISLYQRALASHERFRAVVDRVPAIADDPSRATRTSVEGRVELRGCTFAYPEAEGPVVHDVDLLIEPGQTVALVGEVGAGKSTLIRLIPRFYQAPDGQVLIDGHDVRDYPLEVLRRAIGVVPQRTFLFSASIHENIALGAPDASREEVVRAATLAGLTEDVIGFESGYDTQLGERGVNLSGGQRQRLAIARALVTRPRILLLDDCLSAVDTRTEEAILAGLAEATEGVTTVIVAHRMSTVQHADLICVVDAGRIVERGHHRELLAAGGWYADTWRQQQLEEERDEAARSGSTRVASAGAPEPGGGA